MTIFSINDTKMADKKNKEHEGRRKNSFKIEISPKITSYRCYVRLYLHYVQVNDVYFSLADLAFAFL